MTGAIKNPSEEKRELPTAAPLVKLGGMPRTARIAPGGIIYHVLNRAVGKSTLFRGTRDYDAFQRCLASSHRFIRYSVVDQPMRQGLSSDIITYGALRGNGHERQA
jgi:hypothetical protein